MGRQAAVVLYVLALVAVVVGVDVLFFRNRFWERLIVNVEKRLHTYMEFVSMTTVVRCPRTGRACSEPICQERHWCQQMLECGLSHTGLPLKRKFRPRCCAKTRAGAPCIMRVVPGKRRCRFHGGLSTGPRTAEGRARIAEAQQRRWRSFRATRTTS